MAAPQSHHSAPQGVSEVGVPHGGIVTPEAVLLEFSEAGVGSRALGFSIDLGVRLGILWAIFTVVSAGGPFLDEGLLVMAGVVAGVVTLLVYPVVCETVWNGRTVGKMLVGLRVVTVEGGPARVRHAAIRAALGMVDFWISVGSVAVVSALVSRRSQRLGDLAAGTIVLRERKEGAHAQPILFRPPHGWEPYAQGLDVSPLSDDDYVLIRSYLLRVHELREESRHQRGAELVAWMASRLGVAVPVGHPPETFLVVIAAAYQARHGGPQAAARPGPWGAAIPGVIPPPVWREDEPPPVWGSTSSAS